VRDDVGGRGITWRTRLCDCVMRAVCACPQGARTSTSILTESTSSMSLSLCRSASTCSGWNWYRTLLISTRSPKPSGKHTSLVEQAAAGCLQTHGTTSGTGTGQTLPLHRHRRHRQRSPSRMQAMKASLWFTLGWMKQERTAHRLENGYLGRRSGSLL
jgi:hypothetical protein